MRTRPHRPLLCLSEIFLEAGHCFDRQASRRRTSSRRYSHHRRRAFREWGHATRLADQLHPRFYVASVAAFHHHSRASARISQALRTGSCNNSAAGLRSGFREVRGFESRRPRHSEVKGKMTATTLVAPISLSNDLLTGAEWSPAHTRELLQLSADIKARPVRYASTLQGKFIALIFEKPSLRTRVTFDVGIQSMGGSVVFLDHTQASASLGARESIADVARNLERWVHGIVARVYQQRVLEEMAANASIPVINALSDKFHPCQALADFFTLEEKFGALRGFKLAYVGDGNNVCHSLICLAARLGVHLRI